MEIMYNFFVQTFCTNAKFYTKSNNNKKVRNMTPFFVVGVNIKYKKWYYRLYNNLLAHLWCFCFHHQLHLISHNFGARVHTLC